MVQRLRRSGAVLSALFVTLLSIQVVAAGPASAATCTWPKTGYQYCSGIRHEVISSKFYEGTSQYHNGKGKQDPNLYVNGILKDKQADGECTRLRVRATNGYWPAGNIYTQPDWKVCGAGTKDVIGIFLDQAWTYPGTRIQIQHCYAYDDGAGTHCSTFFERKIPS